MLQAIVIEPSDLKIIIESVIKDLQLTNNYVIEKPMHRKEAAAFLGISVRQLDSLSSAGTLKYHKLEGLKGKLFLPSELLACIKSAPFH